MSEPVTEPTVTADAEPETETPTTATGEVDYKALADKWQALSRKNEKEKKDLLKKAEAFDKLEAAKLSELEKAQARITELEGELTKTQRTALVSKLQAKHGFEDDDLEFLTATDEEGLTAQADKLAKRLGKAGGDASKPRAPQPDLKQGGQKPIALNDFDALTKALMGKVGAK